MAEFQKPVYGTDDIVYLRDSAALGFIEAYRVVNAQFTIDGSVAYVLDTSVRSPTVATFGDMVGPPRYAPLTIHESDLVPYCEALTLAYSYHASLAADLLAKKTAICDS